MECATKALETFSFLGSRYLAHLIWTGKMPITQESYKRLELCFFVERASCPLDLNEYLAHPRRLEEATHSV
jgi:hypothetical protein